MYGVNRQSNLKLSNHKLLPTLLGCLMAGPAASWALGLGELSLQSYLGQAFKASIPVLAGHDEAIQETCFQVGSDHETGLPGVAGIKVVMQQQSDGARLLLSSPHPINEPAVAISVMTDCPQRVSRQYLVLLDPPVIAVPPALGDLKAAQESATPLPNAHPSHTRRSANPHAVAASAKPTRTGGHHAVHAHMANSPGPRLMLSGRSHAAADFPSFGLRLDTSLPVPGKYQDTPLSPNEISDENASLNHKLAYLEQQLAGLQRRNAELEQAALRARAAQPSSPAASLAGAWPAGLALLTGGVLLAWRWRSRRKIFRPITVPDLWAPLAEVAEATVQPEGLPEDSVVQANSQNESMPVAAPASLSMPPVQTRARILDKWAEKNRAAENGVEVDDSLVDEVEVFMAHGHAELAINLLEEHLRAAPDESPIPWMLLLDLLKRQKLAKSYEQARVACKKHFNIRIPDLDEDDPGPGAAGLEAYPHLLAELTRLWGTPECEAYLDDLIFDRRGGSRVGFDPPTYREIMLLRTMQGDEVPPITARYQTA